MEDWQIFNKTSIPAVAYPEVNLGTLQARSAKRERGKISWGSVSSPVGTGQSPVGGRGAKPLENFDDLLVKITFLKLNMPFYET